MGMEAGFKTCYKEKLFVYRAYRTCMRSVISCKALLWIRFKDSNIGPFLTRLYECPNNGNSGFLNLDAVMERFEEVEGRNPGETTISDLPGVLKLKKELCELQVEY